jgi:small-conductance mechanosensitive channel
MSPATTLAEALSGAVAADIMASLAVLAGVLSIRLLAVRALGRSRLTPDVKARWFQLIRTASLVALLAGLLPIWTQELRELALSIAAIAVAFAISLKELILCLHGSFLRTSSRAFSVGDRIQAAGFRGDVVETGALTTTLLEVAGSGSKQTGCSVVIPNSVFIDKAVVNESFAGEYGLFTLRLPVKAEAWSESEQRLLEAARDVCADHLDEAGRHIDAVGWQKGLGPDSIEPSVSVELSKPDEVTLQVRFPAPTRTRGQVEQDILRRFLAGAVAPQIPTEG